MHKLATLSERLLVALKLRFPGTAEEHYFLQDYFASMRWSRIFVAKLAFIAVAWMPFFGDRVLHPPGNALPLLRGAEVTGMLIAALVGGIVGASRNFRTWRLAVILAMLVTYSIGIELIRLQGAAVGFAIPFQAPLLIFVAGFFLMGLSFTTVFLTYGLLFFSYVIVELNSLALSGNVRLSLYIGGVATVLLSMGGWFFERAMRINWARVRTSGTEARTDVRTGLTNARGFDEDFARVLRQAARENVPLTVAFLDIDCFKQLNDLYGHDYGDRVLEALGRLLKGFALRPLDIISRYGGDEFVLVWYGMSQPVASRTGRRLIDAVSALGFENAASSVAPNLSVSIGMTQGRPRLEHTARDWLRRADVALYDAKRAGRNQALVAASPGSAD